MLSESSVPLGTIFLDLGEANPGLQLSRNCLLKCSECEACRRLLRDEDLRGGFWPCALLGVGGIGNEVTGGGFLAVWLAEGVLPDSTFLSVRAGLVIFQLLLCKMLKYFFSS